MHRVWFPVQGDPAFLISEDNCIYMYMSTHLHILKNKQILKKKKNVELAPSEAGVFKTPQGHLQRMGAGVRAVTLRGCCGQHSVSSGVKQELGVEAEIPALADLVVVVVVMVTSEGHQETKPEWVGGGSC